MIDVDKYEEILNSGLLLDHYFVLCRVKDGVKLAENRRIQGFVNLLTKKGYIDNDGNLTERGVDMVALHVTSESNIDSKSEDFATWIGGLHSRCEDKIRRLTGKKQVRDKIEGRYYSFLPNAVDLGKVLYKVVTVYKLKNYKLIENTIMKYIDTCARAGHWFPVLQYYIMKEGMSRLVTDMDAADDVIETTDEVKRVDPKSLF